MENHPGDIHARQIEQTGGSEDRYRHKELDKSWELGRGWVCTIIAGLAEYAYEIGVMRKRVILHEQYRAIHIPPSVGNRRSRNSNEIVVIKGPDSPMS